MDTGPNLRIYVVHLDDTKNKNSKINSPKLRSTTIILDSPKLHSTTALLDGPKLLPTNVILDCLNGHWSKFTDICCSFGRYHKKENSMDGPKLRSTTVILDGLKLQSPIVFLDSQK